MKKKIGIMGGTFNPIHHGHLILAQTAYEQFHLDQILFIPNKNPYYKRLHSIVTEEHRSDMVKLAIAGNDAFAFSDVELQREGNTYTVETLRILTKEHPDTEYYFIMGADSLFHFESWKEHEEIFTLATLLVATRDSVSMNNIESQIEYLEERYDGVKIECLLAPSLEISSSGIRKMIKKGSSIRYLVPDAVAAYINENRIYLEE